MPILPAPEITRLPSVIQSAVPLTLLATPLPDTVQVPVRLPLVEAEPVVIIAVCVLEIVVVPDNVALAIFAPLIIVIESAAIEEAEISLSTVSSLAAIVPLTEIFPKVVVAPLDVEVSANQAAAFASPSAGHTSIVLVVVLYQS
jgi:hypothetical protein